jgi:hypothetical protein
LTKNGRHAILSVGIRNSKGYTTMSRIDVKEFEGITIQRLHRIVESMLGYGYYDGYATIHQNDETLAWEIVTPHWRFTAVNNIIVAVNRYHGGELPKTWKDLDIILSI